MAWLGPCGGCSMGDHSEHVEHWNNPGPGILGGAFCPCAGDCKSPDLSAIFGPRSKPREVDHGSD